MDGRLTATLEGPLGGLSFVDPDSGLEGRVVRYERLLWSRQAALARLRGARVFDLLGAAVVLRDGRHRPAWFLPPGVDQVRAIVIDVNPKGLQPFEIFQVAVHRGL